MRNFVELHRKIANGEPEPLLVNSACVTMVERRRDGAAAVRITEYPQTILLTETYEEVCIVLTRANPEGKAGAKKGGSEHEAH